ncbi:MAG: dephospho-CoA kinase [Bacteroidetes bacterium]|nr:dephospho-CoA kinase [Bacteroidota bacterium]
MIIGLTGGIGSGKSVVARLFEILGCAVFNSDDAAKLVYFNAEIKNRVIELLGNESYTTENLLNKPYISSKIFSDISLLNSLNGIIHPAVKIQFEKFASENAGKIIVKESALLFEANIDKAMDKIVLVVAEDEIRINRVATRDGLSREDILKKMKSQLPQEDKKKLADYIVYNNETEFVITQVLGIYNEIKAHA